MNLPDWFLFGCLWSFLRDEWTASESLSCPSTSSQWWSHTNEHYAVLGVILLSWQNLRVVSCYASGSTEMGSSRQQLFGQWNSGVEFVYIKRITLFKPFLSSTSGQHFQHGQGMTLGQIWHNAPTRSIHIHLTCRCLKLKLIQELPETLHSNSSATTPEFC